MVAFLRLLDVSAMIERVRLVPRAGAGPFKVSRFLRGDRRFGGCGERAVPCRLPPCGKRGEKKK